LRPYQEIPQNTARIARKASKVCICRDFMRAILSLIIARKLEIIDRTR
jgi:hypothetical protein